MHNQYDLSLVLACFNESEIFNGSVSQILNVLDKSNLTYEIIFVDDKSTDNTAKLIKSALKKYPRKKLSAYFHRKNQGRGKTVSEGFLKAKGKIVGFIDIDLEIPAWYIPRFIESMKRNIDGAIAWRIYDLNIKSLMRWVFSKGYIGTRKYLLNLDIHDTESGYKFFLRKKIIPVIKKCQDNHWFWDTEIIARALKANLNLVEIPVVFIRRSDKTSTVKLIPDTINYLKKIISMRKELQLDN